MEHFLCISEDAFKHSVHATKYNSFFFFCHEKQPTQVSLTFNILTTIQIYKFLPPGWLNYIISTMMLSKVFFCLFGWLFFFFFLNAPKIFKTFMRPLSLLNYVHFWMTNNTSACQTDMKHILQKAWGYIKNTKWKYCENDYFPQTRKNIDFFQLSNLALTSQKWFELL